MERELSKFDRESIIGFEFLDTPGDEVAPGSNEIRKNFEYKRLRHGGLLRLRAQTVPDVPIVQSVPDVPIVQDVPFVQRLGKRNERFYGCWRAEVKGKIRLSRGRKLTGKQRVG
jgi:hypothetical protein